MILVPDKADALALVLEAAVGECLPATIFALIGGSRWWGARKFSFVAIWRIATRHRSRRSLRDLDAALRRRSLRQIDAALENGHLSVVGDSGEVAGLRRT